jgi:hypothetical protein
MNRPDPVLINAGQGRDRMDKINTPMPDRARDNGRDGKEGNDSNC